MKFCIKPSGKGKRWYLHDENHVIAIHEDLVVLSRWARKIVKLNKGWLRTYKVPE